MLLEEFTNHYLWEMRVLTKYLTACTVGRAVVLACEILAVEDNHFFSFTGAFDPASLLPLRNGVGDSLAALHHSKS